MDTDKVTKMRFIEEFRRRRISLFTTSDISKIFSLNNDNTLKKLLIRLKKDKIIQRMARDRYQYMLDSIPQHEFTIANFLISPSYISLESALSYYGIIDQFPYRITSIVLGKSKGLKIGQKIFSYSKIKKEYFKDYIKIDNFLIATKEKAVFDYGYFVSKGLRPVNTLLDIAKYLNDKNIRNYLLENGNSPLIKFIKKHVKL